MKTPTFSNRLNHCIFTPALADNEDPTWSAIGDGLMTLRLIEDVFEQVLSIRLQVSHARRDAMYRGGKEDIEKYRTLVVPILKRESDLMGFDCLGEKSLQNLKEQYPDVERRFLPKLCLFYFGIEPRLHNYKCGRLQHAASDVVFDWFGANLETIVFDHERGLWVVPDGFPYRDVIHVFDEEWGAEHKMEEHKTLKPTKTHPKATR